MVTPASLFDRERDLLPVAEEIEASYLPDYGTVKQNRMWQVAYQLKTRCVTVVDGTTEGRSPPLQTMPCHECGIVLPVQ
jgi:hypothetical protein